jgi:hypothetical protein
MATKGDTGEGGVGSTVLEALHDVGFSASEESADEGDDEDGHIRGGPPGSAGLEGRSQKAVALELESSDQDSGGRFTFSCAYNGATGVFYASPKAQEGVDFEGSSQHRAMKGAVGALVDVAEAFQAQKITLALASQHANCAGFVRALLYLGFSVAPSQRKCILSGSALVLEFFLSWAPEDEEDGMSDCSTLYESDVDRQCD